MTYMREKDIEKISSRSGSVYCEPKHPGESLRKYYMSEAHQLAVLPSVSKTTQ